MRLEMLPFRFNEELVTGLLAVFIAEEQHEVRLEGLPIGEVIDSKMPFVAEEIDVLVGLL